MITIMPCLEILKSVTDKNISSEPSKVRVEAFNIATELIAEINADILIPSQIYNRITPRLNDEHKVVFNSLYRIDDSTDVPEFNLYKAVKLLADAESKVRPVIILTENYQAHEEVISERVKIILPKEFIKIIKTIKYWKKKNMVQSYSDALNILLFKDQI